MSKITGNKTRKNKGGLRIANKYDEKTAIIYFLQNSNFSILCDDNVSCIPIIATLKDDKQIIENSPYRNIRTNIMNKPTSRLLLKMFIWGTKDGIVDDDKLRKGYVNVTTTETIKKEVNIQQDLYNKSFYCNKTLMEPLCPSIVFATGTRLSDKTKINVLTSIKNNLLERRGIENPNDKETINRLFNYDIAFMAMEFMEGYDTLSRFTNDSNYENYKKMALYKLDKIHKFGYYHNDFHLHNVMINPTYKYFTTQNKCDFGNAIIIDFGLSYKISETVDINNIETRKKLLTDEYGIINIKNIIEKFDVYDSKHMLVQYNYVEEFETKLKVNIMDIIKGFNIYKGIGGRKNIKKMDKDDEEYNAKQSKILDDWLKTIPKKKKREEHLIVLDEKVLEENRKRDVTAFEEKLKTNDPKYYEEFMKNLEELRKELDKDPDFLHKLIRDELTPVKITYDFTFENTDS
jgi:hypothetical protein